jgi:hypothetical protein
VAVVDSLLFVIDIFLPLACTFKGASVSPLPDKRFDKYGVVCPVTVSAVSALPSKVAIRAEMLLAFVILDFAEDTILIHYNKKNH